MPLGRHLPAELLAVDVQPAFVRVLANGRLLLIHLPEARRRSGRLRICRLPRSRAPQRVNAADSSSSRSTATGVLLVSMPKIDPPRRAPRADGEQRSAPRSAAGSITSLSVPMSRVALTAASDEEPPELED